jgi:Phosphoesterase family
MQTGDGRGRGGETPPGLSRRRLLQGATATTGLFTLGQGAQGRTATAQTDDLPAPEASGIEHIVWVMMENRSFDHFLGWLPGANGQQAGLTYPDRTGGRQPTHRLAPDFQGCGHPDPDHSYQGGRVAYHGGRSMGGSRLVRTTPLRSAITQTRTSPSWGKPPAPGQSAITTSRLSWPPPFRIASISMPRRPTA